MESKCPKSVPEAAKASFYSRFLQMTHYIAELSDDKDSGPKNLAAPFAFFWSPIHLKGLNTTGWTGSPLGELGVNTD